MKVNHPFAREHAVLPSILKRAPSLLLSALKRYQSIPLCPDADAASVWVRRNLC